MTFCRILAEAQRGPDTVTAYELTEKFSACPRYEIVEICNDTINRHNRRKNPQRVA